LKQLAVVLVAPRNPLNIGAVARAMTNFGFSDLRLVQAYDVAYREARSAVHAAAVLHQARQFATLDEAVADCTLVVGSSALARRTAEHPVRRLETAGQLIRAAMEIGPVALVFGGEKSGLSNEDLSYCHWVLTIPTQPDQPSMNLGQAVALCLWELVRAEQSVGREPQGARPATAQQLETIHQLLAEILKLAGYVQERTATSSELKLRRLIHRLALSEHDAVIWLGMLRQILWKLRGRN
jgi:tRNA/rRNA methyltransferase